MGDCYGIGTQNFQEKNKSSQEQELIEQNVLGKLGGFPRINSGLDTLIEQG